MPSSKLGLGARVAGKRNYPHVQRFLDRHGRPRAYFRRRLRGGGFSKANLTPYLPEGSPQWDLAYAQALAGVKPTERRVADGKTWGAVIASYKQTHPYKKLAKASLKHRNYWCNSILEDFGDAPVGEITRDQLSKLIAAEAEQSRGGARAYLSTWRVLTAHAIEDLGWRSDDPAVRIKRPELLGNGKRTWKPEEVEQYRRCYPLGTVARLAIEILYATGLRRFDATVIGWHHFDTATQLCKIAPNKTRNAKKKLFAVFPVIPELAEALKAAGLTVGISTWLIDPKTGEPYDEENFGKEFRKWVDAAGLPKDLSAHGLRKACFTRLAQMGCSPHRIRAWSGHAELKQVQTYTEAVDQLQLSADTGRLFGAEVSL